eukprot:3641914-Pyramimonas_sp.AAC.1
MVLRGNGVLQRAHLLQLNGVTTEWGVTTRTPADDVKRPGELVPAEAAVGTKRGVVTGGVTTEWGITTHTPADVGERPGELVPAEAMAGAALLRKLLRTVHV